MCVCVISVIVDQFYFVVVDSFVINILQFKILSVIKVTALNNNCGGIGQCRVLYGAIPFGSAFLITQTMVENVLSVS